MGTFSYTLKCKLQPLNCLTLIGTEGPAEVDVLHGDASKARTTLGWEAECSLEQLVSEMLEADMKRVTLQQNR
jgi:nucleoside-diphosphate-sugar epimerase